MIHETAIINPKAEIDADVEIGPFSIIHENVKIASGTKIGSHVVIEPYVTIKENCRVYQYAAIGAVPQHLKFSGEKTYLRIGKNSVIREFVTIHRGTEFGGGITEIGEDNYLMAYSHVAHDCKIGRNVILSNCVQMAGHITIGDYVYMGALVGIHQFVRIGEYAFVGGKAAIVKDIPPYCIASGDRAKLHGLNTIGLKRQGFSDKTLSEIKKVYRIMFRIGLTMNEAIERIKAEVEQIPEVRNFLEFITTSERGITR